MGKRSYWLFVACIVGLALSAVVLISLIPPLFDSGAGNAGWPIWTAGCLVVAFGVAARLLKNTPPSNVP